MVFHIYEYELLWWYLVFNQVKDVEFMLNFSILKHMMMWACSWSKNLTVLPFEDEIPRILWHVSNLDLLPHYCNCTDVETYMLKIMQQKLIGTQAFSTVVKYGIFCCFCVVVSDCLDSRLLYWSHWNRHSIECYLCFPYIIFHLLVEA